MSPGFLAEFIGALLITFLLNRALHHLFRRMRPLTKRAYVVALAGVAVAVGIATIGMGFREAITIYPLAVALWLVADLVRFRGPAAGTSAPEHDSKE